MAYTTNYINSSGYDVGSNVAFYIPKSYILDRYAEMPNIFKAPTVWTWGSNFYGGIGDNTTNTASSPVQTVAGGTNWKQVSSSGFGFKAAIKTDGTLWLWGRNIYGQLGDNTITDKSSPVQTVAGGTNWKQVSTGSNFVGAIKTDGTLWVWGINDTYQLGDSGSSTRQSSPIQTASGGTNWKQVSAGYSHIGAIKTDGTLWMWGSYNKGELGNSDSATQVYVPTQIGVNTNWTQISCGQTVSAGIKSDGTLWTWGLNQGGILGDGTSVYPGRSSPVQTIAGGTNWKQVSCEGGFFMAAIKTDGTLWMWGQNTSGELATGNRTDRSSPVQTISAGTNWYQVSGSSAIKTDGTLWAWAGNLYYQLTSYVSSPVQIYNGGGNWKQVSNGIAIRDDSSDMFGNPY